MKGESSSSSNNSFNILGLSRYLVALTAIAAISLWIFTASIFKEDPYVATSLQLQGSIDHGDQLFRVNCVGCHGITGQGLLGPDLHEASSQLSDRKIINQIIKGRTPPMPRFEIKEQEMADLLAYLHSLN